MKVIRLLYLAYSITLVSVPPDIRFRRWARNTKQNTHQLPADLFI